MAKNSVKKNFAYQMVYEVLVLILPLITSPYIARVIGAEGLGIYSYTYTIANYFVLFSMLGIRNYGNRVIAQHRDDREDLSEQFSSLLIIHVLVSIVFCLVYLLYAFLGSSYRWYALIQGAFVLSALFDISWFYFGIEAFKLTVIRNVIIKLITVGLIFALVRSKQDLWVYCAIMSVSMLVSQIVLWIPLKKYVSFKVPEFSSIIAHIKPLVILFIPAIAISLYKYMDKIMIGSISTKTQLGFYENAEKVINIPLTIIGAFGTVMLPKMSNLLSNNDNGSASKYIMDSMRYVMCLAFALAFGMAGVGRTFAPVFWGAEFAYSGTIIRGLSITMPFIAFANVIRTQYLIPTEKDKEYLGSVIAGAVINLIINWLLIPNHGALGATIGTIAAEATVCIIQAWVVRKELTITKYLRNCVPFIFIGAIMYILVFGFGEHNGISIITLAIQIMIGVILYCAGSFLYLNTIREPVFIRTIKQIKSRINKT